MVGVAVKNLERGLDTFNALAMRGMYGDMRFALASVRVRNMIKTGRVEMDGRTATSVTEHAKDISQFEKLTALRAVRRVAALGAPSGRTAAASAPPRMRAVHGSSYGFLCPSSTPEGAGVGMSLLMLTG